MHTSTSMPRTAGLRWDTLESIVPPAVLRSATHADAIDGCAPQRVAVPNTVQEVSDILKWADSAKAHVAVRGGRTKSTWANPATQIDLVLSTERLNRIVEHAAHDLTVTVQAGVTIKSLQEQLATKGQRLALDVLWPEKSTVGGVVATNDSGALRLRFGSVRDLILGATVVLADGTIARSGGKVVKNVAGYDLQKLFTGSFGTLGVIAEATFRVYPLPQMSRTQTFRFTVIERANEFVMNILNSSLVPASVQIRSADESHLVDALFEGVAAGVEEQVARTLGMAGGAEESATADDARAVWNARQMMFTDSASDVVCKFSVLPSDIALTLREIERLFGRCDAVSQATGLGLFRVSTPPEDGAASIQSFRGWIEDRGGSLMLLKAPREFRSAIDVFGGDPGTHALMRRVKDQLDPNHILNAGRFVAGI